MASKIKTISVLREKTVETRLDKNKLTNLYDVKSL